MKHSIPELMILPILCLLLALVPGRVPSKITKILKGPVEESMHMPSQVLALPQGGTVVLDGARCRLAFFQEDGAFQEYVGSRGSGPGEFMFPLGICLGPGGELIVADTENHRFQVFDESGELLRVQAMSGVYPLPRATGLACDPAGMRIYVTDTRNQAVQVYRFPGLSHERSLALDVSMGEQPAWPCAPMWKAPHLYLVEPLNGRIRVVHPETGSHRFMAAFGLGPGRLFRPKGLAMDKEGRLLVSDSWTGLLSLFDGAGSFLGRLAGPDGKERLFQAPCGLDVDSFGILSVVEMGKDRVVRLEAAADNLLAGGPGRTVPDLLEEERLCALCHPESLQADAPSMDKPRLPAAHAHPAGDEAMCLSCHDGALVDSRHTAFADHSHHGGKLGDPNQGMVNPLPLGPEGKMTCMTCHKAHDGEEHKNHAKRFQCLTRIPGPRGALCLHCHEGYHEKSGGHFMGAAGFPVPESLIHQGAAPSGDGEGTLSCRTCHLPHGDGKSALLVGGPSGPCGACHDPGSHDQDAHFRSGSFDCWDCHAAHGAKKGAPSSCTECHFAQKAILGTAHHGSDSGAGCEDCHAPFGALLNSEATPCLHCHEEGRGQASTFVPIHDHPGDMAGAVVCTLCHDPHRDGRDFLKPGVAEKVCADCHGLEALWRYLYFHQENRTPTPGKGNR